MEWSQDDTGITASFKIAKTTAGNDALEEAATGLRSDFSVGVDVEEWDNKGGVMAISASKLIEVSLVTDGAIPGAEVQKVAAEKNKVSPQIINGEIATKPEYLIMLSSFGLLATLVIFYFFVRSNCLFFIWFQKLIGIKSQMASQASFQKSRAVITFIETIVIIWFFYVALLLLYDEQILGEKHWFAYVFAYGSLLWSVYLIIQLMKIKTFDYSLRYAIPTVIIFWNFVEIIGRWGLLEEIWIQPLTYKLEITLFFITGILLVFILLFNAKFQKTKLNNL
jgi:hypothetical protein